MDRELSAHRKAWDACFEVAVMSICHGLLCTHSFMANMAIYYSCPPYPYRSFWDPLQGHDTCAAGTAGIPPAGTESAGFEGEATWEGVE